MARAAVVFHDSLETVLARRLVLDGALLPDVVVLDHAVSRLLLDTLRDDAQRLVATHRPRLFGEVFASLWVGENGGLLGAGESGIWR